MPALSADSSALLVVDLQERLMPAISGGPEVLRNAGRLVRAATRLAVPVTTTEQDPAKLGPTVDEIAAVLPGPAVAKSTFAASLELRARAVVCGCEAHVCVLQTVLALRESGHDVAVVADAIGSRAPENRDAALARMRDHGVEVVTTEMVVFEWLGSSENPAFREVQALIK
ncbi:isochorismatase family protein [Actinomycetospora chiangmaiensis]|uniref:isochorismatase family protein n=1 Tax=Actinomycetospora chiangmaiensis TaxID=402650 RepID=UPI0003612E1C|nr:isochorismatase family protein [Actinomycetospora chiangmaiensis]